MEHFQKIFIETANRFAKGFEHVRPYKLVFVGAERICISMRAVPSICW